MRTNGLFSGLGGVIWKGMSPNSPVNTPRSTPPSRNFHAAQKVASMILAASLTVSIMIAPAAVAEGAPQEWVPYVLDFPDDLEVLSSREIGSTVRMFSIGTHADPDALMAAWEQALRTNGFIIKQNLRDVLDRAIEFSGPGIGNAKIVVAPRSGTDDTNIIEFDATLR